MTQAAETTAVFNYRPSERSAQQNASAHMQRLARAAAVEPILKRWRHCCSEGLIDETGKIRNVFTKVGGAQHSVSQVIEELNQVPQAVAEFEAALQARRQLDAASRHAVEMPVHNARLLEDAQIGRLLSQFLRLYRAVAVCDTDQNDQAIVYLPHHPLTYGHNALPHSL